MRLNRLEHFPALVVGHNAIESCPTLNFLSCCIKMFSCEKEFFVHSVHTSLVLIAMSFNAQEADGSMANISSTRSRWRQKCRVLLSTAAGLVVDASGLCTGSNDADPGLVGKDHRLRLRTFQASMMTTTAGPVPIPQDPRNGSITAAVPHNKTVIPDSRKDFLLPSPLPPLPPPPGDCRSLGISEGKERPLKPGLSCRKSFDHHGIILHVMVVENTWFSWPPALAVPEYGDITASS